MLNSRHAALALVPLAFIGLCLSGCSAGETTDVDTSSETDTSIFNTPEEGRQFAIANHYDLMAQILEDGEVSREEYQSAFDADVSCKERNNWTFDSEDLWNPVDRLRLIREGKPPAAGDSKDFLKAESICAEQFEFVSYLFQTTAKPETDPPLLAYVENCLDDENISYEAGQGSIRELVGTDAANSPEFDVILECINSGMAKLYPGLHGFSIAL